MTRRNALLFLGLASPALLVCSWFSGFVAELCFLILVMAFPASLIVLAVSRDGRVGPLTGPLVAMTTLLEFCGVAMFLLRGHVVDVPWFGGFPIAASIQVYGLWLGPLLLVALAYGWTFDRWVLTEEDIHRFEDRRKSNSSDVQQ